MPYARLQDNPNSSVCNSRFQENYESVNTVSNGYLNKNNKNGSNCYTGYICGSSSDENYDAVGYKKSILLLVLFYLCNILTVGTGFLVAYWRPDWKVKCIKRKCPLSHADTLILTDTEGTNFVVCVESEDYFADIPQEYNISNDNFTSKRTIRYFVFQYLKYIWNRENGGFECFVGLANNNTTVHSLLKEYKGYGTETQYLRLGLYGLNNISVEVKSVMKLLITELLHPFYLFQVASLVLWSCDGYVLYAVCIFIITCISIGTALRETRQQSTNLRNMVEASNANTVLVLRDPGALNPVEENAINLVPGDVIVIPPTGGIMACDAVLISGNAIVNESMLTGESVPVTKTSLTSSEEEEIYSPEKHKRQTLFCGTNVIQTRYYGKEQVLAVVVRTGFSTAKGELVRSILYPRSIVFKFYDASMKFIMVMFIISSIGMGYSLYLHITRKKPIMTTIIRTLDIVTIAVPPALPAAMTVGTYYAQSRLKKSGIFCISPPRINVGGKLKLVCFDKTGTLTEDGLDVWGVVEVEKGKKGACHLGIPCHQVDLLDHRSLFMAALASCHSLTYINGQLTGDPLDIQMFEATKWGLLEPDKEEIFDSLVPTIVRPPTNLLFSPYDEQSIPTVLSEDQNERDLGWGRSEDIEEVDDENVPLLNGCVGGSETKSNASTCTSKTFNRSSNWKKNYEAISGVDEVDAQSQHPVTVEQIMVEMVKWEDKYSTTIIKPFLSETIVSVRGIEFVAETTFKVPYEIGLVRQFPFSSSLQRMSVIVRALNKPHMDLFCKGAPEVIQHMCNPDTVPENFASVLNQFTVQGFRVIALAHKELDSKLTWHAAQRVKRNKVENDLTFLGLLILQNVLKPETAPVIAQLKAANIRTVMITGDNILTGICVARDCGMVDKKDKVLLAKVTAEDNGHQCLSFETAHSGGLEDTFDASQEKCIQITIEKEDKYHLAITGQVWAQIKEHFPEYIPYIVSQGTIFARMSPDQKVQVVEELQKLDYVVGMCGDGANDCGALKAAHVGISLSEAEASVAAPFTSHVPNITCVPIIICEGRAALATNFSTFKFMALYSIIQFVSILILYTYCTNFSDAQFLFIDLFTVTTIALFMGYTTSLRKLVRERPLSNLTGFVNLFSLSSQILLVIIFQVLAYCYLKMQPWYDHSNDCTNPDSDNIVNTWETNVVFSVSSFQYLALAVIYSPGRPFRKPLYTNIWLIVTIIILLSFTSVLLLYPVSLLELLLELTSFPGDPIYKFRGGLFLIAALHFVLGWSIEYFIAGSSTLKRIFQFISCKKRPKNLYKRIANQIKNDPHWPPVENPIYSSITS